MRKALFLFVLPFLVLSNSACEKGLAYGDPNAVIVVAQRDWWPSIEETVVSGLSPEVFTVRWDHTFRVSFSEPTDDLWWRFHEVVIIGGPEDQRVAEALAFLPDTVPIEVPNIYEVENVWAKNQNVTVVVVDPTGDIPYQVGFRVPKVHEILEKRFLGEAATRMFLSGRDSALADTLQALAGFSLLLPEVYEWGSEDSVYIFRNDNPDPAELIRQFTVTWRSPVPSLIAGDSLLDWRTSLAEQYFSYPQVVEREELREGRVGRYDWAEAYAVQGVWKNPPGSTWPAAGAVVTWGVHCSHQNRLFLLDAWLYSPGNDRDKWEYMVQLDTIMHSFRCGGRPR